MRRGRVNGGTIGDGGVDGGWGGGSSGGGGLGGGGGDGGGGVGGGVGHCGGNDVDAGNGGVTGDGGCGDGDGCCCCDDEDDVEDDDDGGSKIGGVQVRVVASYVYIQYIYIYTKPVAEQEGLQLRCIMAQAGSVFMCGEQRHQRDAQLPLLQGENTLSRETLGGAFEGRRRNVL